MNIEQLKIQLCGLIDEAYSEAKRQGQHQIFHPFKILIRDDEQVEYFPLTRQALVALSRQREEPRAE
jgi:hypothetical protein